MKSSSEGRVVEDCESCAYIRAIFVTCVGLKYYYDGHVVPVSNIQHNWKYTKPGKYIISSVLLALSGKTGYDAVKMSLNKEG